ncbi:MAG: hypothetical protein OEM29_07505, partial [Thermoplasmata archaeon]|nr:hypothetical protein [Thermoplasmata archaeon]
TSSISRVRKVRTQPTAMRSDMAAATSEISMATTGADRLDMYRVAIGDSNHEGAVRGSACGLEDQRDECDEVERQLLSIISRGSVYTDVELSNDVVIDDDDQYRKPTVVSGLELSRKMKRDLAKKGDAS